MHKITTFIPLFVILSFFNFQIQAQNWDIELLESVNKTSNPYAKGYSTFISETTIPLAFATPVIIGSVALINGNEEQLREAIYIGASIVSSSAIMYALKASINRERPYLTYPNRIDNYKVMTSTSMPSGHSSLAFSTATSLSLQYPKWYVIAPSFLWAGSVGFSRMNLGVHYPTDVLAGAALGVGSAYLTFLANKWFWKKYEAKKSYQTYLDW